MKILKQFVPFLIVGLILSGGDSMAQSKKEKKAKKEKEEKLIELSIIEEKLETQKEQQLKELEALLNAKYLDEEKLKHIIEEQSKAQKYALEGYHFDMKDIKKDLEKMNVPVMDFRVMKDHFPANVSDWYGQSKESTSLTIRKTIEDLTFSTKFKYNVQEGSNSFHFVANGSIEDGTILIKLINPSGKTIHEFEVSPLADVNWSQNFVWDEENAKKNTGTWTIMVSAKQATGRYSVSVRAN